MRTLVMWGVALALLGCQSPEEKEARRLETARTEAAQRRAKSPLATTRALNLLPAQTGVVLRLTPAGVELDDLTGGEPVDGGAPYPRPLDRFKAMGTEGWLELPLMVAAVREVERAPPRGHPKFQVLRAIPQLSLDVTPDTPAFRVVQVLSELEWGKSYPHHDATLETPLGLRSVRVESETLNSQSERCAHPQAVPTPESCVVPRVALGVEAAKVLVRAGTADCYVADTLREPDDHVWNEGPFLTTDGGCRTRGPEATASLVREVVALAPGCSHVLIELAGPEVPWSSVGPVLGALAADDPLRRMVLSMPYQPPDADCARATRPAGWQRFIQRAPRPARRPDAGR